MKRNPTPSELNEFTTSHWESAAVEVSGGVMGAPVSTLCPHCSARAQTQSIPSSLSSANSLNSSSTTVALGSTASASQRAALSSSNMSSYGPCTCASGTLRRTALDCELRWRNIQALEVEPQFTSEQLSAIRENWSEAASSIQKVSFDIISSYCFFFLFFFSPSFLFLRKKKRNFFPTICFSPNICNSKKKMIQRKHHGVGRLRKIPNWNLL